MGTKKRAYPPIYRTRTRLAIVRAGYTAQGALWRGGGEGKRGNDRSMDPVSAPGQERGVEGSVNAQV